MSTRLPALILLATAALAACSESSTPEAAPAPAPALTAVSAERTDLLFRYRGADGQFGSATTLDEIPADARANVQVIDLSRSPDERNAASVVQIFDLRSAGSDGRYPGRFVPRAELESALAAKATPSPQASVTMYSASWCGVCRQARSYLQKERIAFVEKDIEKDAAAARELARKSKAAGVPTGGVPVFDVGGRLFNGFDAPTLMRAIRGAGPG